MLRTKCHIPKWLREGRVNWAECSREAVHNGTYGKRRSQLVTSYLPAGSQTLKLHLQVALKANFLQQVVCPKSPRPNTPNRTKCSWTWRTGGQVFKDMSLWGTFVIQTTRTHNYCFYILCLGELIGQSLPELTFCLTLLSIYFSNMDSPHEQEHFCSSTQSNDSHTRVHWLLNE